MAPFLNRMQWVCMLVSSVVIFIAFLPLEIEASTISLQAIRASMNPADTPRISEKEITLKNSGLAGKPMKGKIVGPYNSIRATTVPWALRHMMSQQINGAPEPLVYAPIYKFVPNEAPKAPDWHDMFKNPTQFNTKFGTASKEYDVMGDNSNERMDPTLAPALFQTIAPQPPPFVGPDPPGSGGGGAAAGPASIGAAPAGPPVDPMSGGMPPEAAGDGGGGGADQGNGGFLEASAVVHRHSSSSSSSSNSYNSRNKIVPITYSKGPTQLRYVEEYHDYGSARQASKQLKAQPDLAYLESSSTATGTLQQSSAESSSTGFEVDSPAFVQRSRTNVAAEEQLELPSQLFNGWDTAVDYQLPKTYREIYDKTRQ